MKSLTLFRRCLLHTGDRSVVASAQMGARDTIDINAVPRVPSTQNLTAVELSLFWLNLHFRNAHVMHSLRARTVSVSVLGAEDDGCRFWRLFIAQFPAKSIISHVPSCALLLLRRCVRSRLFVQ
jgi:hypothetical protein